MAQTRPYSVPVRFVFDGKFVIKAGSQAEAEKSVREHCGLVLGGNIHSSVADDAVTRDFNVFPQKIVGRKCRRRLAGPK